MSRTNSFLWAVCAVVCGTGATVHAQLTWTGKTLELHSDSTVPTLEGSFHFVNAGPTGVDIARVVTSCGCTSASLTQNHFEPGQSGDIRITYRRGSYTGLQKKEIAVEVTGQPTTILTLLVDIPPIVRIEPAFVTWRHEEAKTSKTLDLKLLVPGKITALEVQSSEPSVTASVQPVLAGQEYRLLVVPGDVSHFVRSVLTITCELDGKDRKTFTSYATVQPAIAR